MEVIVRTFTDTPAIAIVNLALLDNTAKYHINIINFCLAKISTIWDALQLCHIVVVSPYIWIPYSLCSSRCFTTMPWSYNFACALFLVIFGLVPDPCNATTCQNGGSCQSYDGYSFWCMCANGYSGQHCEISSKYLFLLSHHISQFT